MFERLDAATKGIGRSVDYTRPVAYRRPPRLYRHLQCVGVLLTSLGLVPHTVVVLEVRGRRSGRLRRTVVVRVPYQGDDYLVALAGESEWVRNVRAASGQAVIHHGRAERVQLVEVPAERRGPILWAYLHRPGWSSPAQEAQHYFGLRPDPTVKEFQPIVDRYPVFRITRGQAGRSEAATVQKRVGAGRKPREVAAGVYRLSVYGANVYFVRSEASWVLVDAAWAWGGCARIIQQAAEVLLGPSTAPTAILLTHVHPDHDGAALELAQVWGCPVYVHPDELRLARAVAAGDLVGIERNGNGLDRRVIVPLLRVLPGHGRAKSTRPTMADVAQVLDNSQVPGLSDWKWVATRGHTPGHVVFFRSADRVLLAGDAVLTVDAGSVGGWVRWALGSSERRAWAPPPFTNWDQAAADASVGVLAALEPRVLACGHGAPLVGEPATRELRALVERMAGTTSHR